MRFDGTNVSEIAVTASVGWWLKILERGSSIGNWGSRARAKTMLTKTLAPSVYIIFESTFSETQRFWMKQCLRSLSKYLENREPNLSLV